MAAAPPRGRADRCNDRAPTPGGGRAEGSKPRFNKAYSLALFDIYGALPTAASHTKEYVPFFQGHGKAPVQPEPIRPFDAASRAEEMRRAWQVTREYASGERTAGEFLDRTVDDHASDIIESMWARLGKPFYLNTWNRGAVGNLPADAFLELRSDLDMRGPARSRCRICRAASSRSSTRCSIPTS